MRHEAEARARGGGKLRPMQLEWARGDTLQLAPFVPDALRLLVQRFASHRARVDFLTVRVTLSWTSTGGRFRW